jgi:hypothetical protein
MGRFGIVFVSFTFTGCAELSDPGAGVGATPKAGGPCEVSLAGPAEGSKASVLPQLSWTGTCEGYRLELSATPDFETAQTLSYGLFERLSARVQLPTALRNRFGATVYWRVLGGLGGGVATSEVRTLALDPEGAGPEALQSADCAVATSTPVAGTPLDEVTGFAWTGACDAYRIEVSGSTAFPVEDTLTFGSMSRTSYRLTRGIQARLATLFPSGAYWRVVGGGSGADALSEPVALPFGDQEADADTITDTDADTDADAPVYPADLLDLSMWKITLPIDDDGSGTADEIKHPAIETYSSEEWFHLNEAKDGVVFFANCGGATTSGSDYARSELRELESDGYTKAAWSSTEGVHTLTVTEAFTRLPEVRSKVSGIQVHDADDDVLMVRLEDSRLFVKVSEDELATFTSSSPSRSNRAMARSG